MLPRLQLLDLPNELLDAIALQTDPSTNVDLLSLSLVCRRLQTAAQSALLKPVAVSPHSIQKLVGTLIGRPDLALQISQLNWTEHSWIRFVSEWSKDCPEFTECKRLITSLPVQGNYCWAWITLLAHGGLNEDVFFAILVFIAPNLRKLVLKKRPGSRPSSLNGPVRLRSLLGTFYYPGLGKRIKALIIEEEDWMRQSFRRLPWHFTPFRALKHLTLPMDIIADRHGSFIQPGLPPSLEHLVVRFGSWTRLTLELLEFILRNGNLTKLKSLELSFTSNIRSTILLVGQGNRTRHARFSAAVHALTDNGVQITAFAPTGYAHASSPPLIRWGTQRLKTELSAFTSLSVSEISVAALRGCDFSEIPARDRTGAPRPRSKFEQLLFVRFWRMPLALFTSPTFHPPAWSGIRMFNGQTAVPMRPGPRVARGSEGRPTNIPCWREGLGEKKNDLCSCTFKSDPELIGPAPEMSTFDVIRWSKVDFFKAPEKKTTSVKAGASEGTRSHNLKRGREPTTMLQPRRRRRTSLAQDLKEVSELVKNWRL